MYRLLSRLFLSLATAIVLCLAGTLIVTPSVVHAAPTVDVSCTGTSTLHYNPSLTSSPQSSTITEQGILDSCLVSSDPNIPSGTYASSGTGSLTCVSSSALIKNTVYHWKNGKSSTVAFITRSATNYASVTVLTDIGTISSGEFTGDRIMQTSTFMPDVLPPCTCCTNSSAISSSLALTITHW